MPVMVDGVGTAMDYAYYSFNQVTCQMLLLLDFVVVAVCCVSSVKPTCRQHQLLDTLGLFRICASPAHLSTIWAPRSRTYSEQGVSCCAWWEIRWGRLLVLGKRFQSSATTVADLCRWRWPRVTAATRCCTAPGPADWRHGTQYTRKSAPGWKLEHGTVVLLTIRL